MAASSSRATPISALIRQITTRPSSGRRNSCCVARDAVVRRRGGSSPFSSKAHRPAAAATMKRLPHRRWPIASTASTRTQVHRLFSGTTVNGTITHDHDDDDDNDDDNGETPPEPPRRPPPPPPPRRQRLDLDVEFANAPASSLYDRVERVMDVPLGSIHPLDFAYVCPKLLRDCCRVPLRRRGGGRRRRRGDDGDGDGEEKGQHDVGGKGMRYAERLLNRIIDEKRYVNDRLGGWDDDTDHSDRRRNVVVKAHTFHILMYGYATKSSAMGIDGPRSVERWMERMMEEHRYDVETEARSRRDRVREALHDRFDVVDEAAGGGETAIADVDDEEELEWEDALLDELDEEEKNGKDSAQGGDDTKSRRSGGQADLTCQPNRDTYHTYLLSLANASRLDPECASIAERTLHAMVERNEIDGWHVRPNNRSYSYVLSALAEAGKSSSRDRTRQNRQRRRRTKPPPGEGRGYTDLTDEKDVGNRAMRLLDQLKASHRLEAARYLEAFGDEYDASHPDTNRKRILTPDVCIYTGVINVISSSGRNDAAERAEEVFFEALPGGEGYEKYGVRPDATLFGMAIQVWSDVAGRRKGTPASIVAAERAEKILDLLVELSVKAKAEAVEKGTGVGGREGHDVSRGKLGGVNEREGKEPLSPPVLAPTTAAFNASIHAWARSDTHASAPRAEALLGRMLDAALDDGAGEGVDNPDAAAVIPLPDGTSFNTVINALARYGRYDPTAAERAEEMLDVMYDLYHSGQFDDGIKPTVVTYTSIINAWARSKDDLSSEEASGGSHASNHKVVRARRLLDAMLQKFESGEEDLKPGILAYTAVLNAAAHCAPSPPSLDGGSRAHDDPYSIARRTYDELSSGALGLSIMPDHVTFKTMLHAARVHLDAASDEKRRAVERIFDDACAAGQVSAGVVTELQKASSRDLLERLLGSRKLAQSMSSIDELSEKWTRFVGRERKLRQLDVRGGGGGGLGRRSNDGKECLPAVTPGSEERKQMVRKLKS